MAPGHAVPVYPTPVLHRISAAAAAEVTDHQVICINLHIALCHQRGFQHRQRPHNERSRHFAAALLFLHLAAVLTAAVTVDVWNDATKWLGDG